MFSLPQNIHLLNLSQACEEHRLQQLHCTCTRTHAYTHTQQEMHKPQIKVPKGNISADTKQLMDVHTALILHH